MVGMRFGCALVTLSSTDHPENWQPGNPIGRNGTACDAGISFCKRGEEVRGKAVFYNLHGEKDVYTM
jgi:hypothetical protein